MAGNTQWKEATSGSVIQLEAGERLEGKFLSIEESSLYPDSFALKLDVKGESKVVFVNNIVKDLLNANGIKVGQEVAVLYAGMKENQSKTRSYKNYKVFFK